MFTRIPFRAFAFAVLGLTAALLPGCPYGLKLHGEGACEGYTLINRASGNRDDVIAKLIDMDGNVVHEWPINGHPARMLPGGSLLGAVGSNAAPAPEEQAMVQVAWDGTEEWRFDSWDVNRHGVLAARQHHDWQREGNPVGYYSPGAEFAPHGNTLVLAHESRSIPEIGDVRLQADVIYEVDWEGNQTGFLWRAADHFEDFGFDDAAIAGMRTWMPIILGDWLHTNSMSELGENHWYGESGDERFNPRNIIWCSRNSEIMAIISRESGAIVWQLGPDYGPGTPGERIGQLIGMHHAHMIPVGLPGAGNILVFDNGGYAGFGGPLGFGRDRRAWSRIIEFDPVTLDIVWQYGAEEGPEYFYSIYMSSAQRLPNGNTLITDGDSGHVFEVTAAKEIVWSYVSPGPSNFLNHVYRAYRVPPEWLPEGINPGGYAPWSELFEH